MLTVAACVASLSLAALDGEHLVIYPRIPGVTYEQLRTRDDGTVVGAFIPPRADGVIDLDAALSPFPGAPYVDVEEGVVWEIVSGEDVAVVNDLGEVTFTGFGRARVRARLGAVVSDEFPIAKVESAHMGPWNGEHAGGPRTPLPTNDELAGAVRGGIRSLEQLGVAPSILSVVAGMTDIQTNSGTTWIGPGSFMGNSDTAAAYTHGAKETPGGGVYISGPLVVVADGVAASLVANGMFGGDGLLNDAGQSVVHELVHAALDKLDLKMPEALEETLAHTFAETMVNKLIDLTKRLQDAAQNGAAPQNRQRILNLIQSLSKDLKTVRDEAKSASDSAKLDTALTMLNLDDSDGDGIPDFIEDIIDRLFPNGRPEWLENLSLPSTVRDAGGATQINPY